MYCKKCGRFVGTYEDMCDQCKQFENTRYYQPPSNYQDTSAINLGGAIAAMIVSTLGYIFSYVALYLGLSFLFDTTASIITMIIGLIPAFIGLFMGIASISNFKHTSYIKSGKRIPVLILGIASIINAGVSFFLSLLLLLSLGLMI